MFCGHDSSFRTRFVRTSDKRPAVALWLSLAVVALSHPRLTLSLLADVERTGAVPDCVGCHACCVSVCRTADWASGGRPSVHSLRSKAFAGEMDEDVRIAKEEALATLWATLPKQGGQPLSSLMAVLDFF